MLVQPVLAEVQLVPLSWDQTHTINFTTTYAADSWGMSVIGQYGSGMPYTPIISKDISTILTNRAKKPVQYDVDLNVYKIFKINKLSFTAFLRVLNLFDRLNESNVYTDTGRAGETIDEYRARQSLGEGGGEWINTLDEWFTNATHYTEPRRIEMGITVNF